MVILRNLLAPVLLVTLSVLTLGFVAHALVTGSLALGGDATVLGRLYSFDSRLSNSAIALHMVAGGVITGLAPIQVIAPIRRRWPRVHRMSGYVLATLAVMTALGGFAFILHRGTIGGPLMTTGFSLYGALMLIAAVQTVRYARARQFDIHRRWALRLFVLAIGSWLYRVHYGVWYALTGGTASTLDFTGLFDQVQVFAFYLPYLLLLELYLRMRPHPA